MTPARLVRASPNAVRVAGLRLVRAYVCARPGMGQVIALSTASVPNDPATWGLNSGVTVTGAGPYSVRGTAVSEQHFLRKSGWTNYTLAPTRFASRATPIGVQRYLLVLLGSTQRICYDLLTGAIAATSGVVTNASIVAAGGGAWDISFTATPNNTELYVCLANTGTTAIETFVSAPANGVELLTGGVVYQRRFAGITGLSRDPAGALRGEHVNQATPALQPLAWIETLGGVWVPHTESGRQSYLASVDADVLSAVTGDDPSYVVAWIARFSGTDACPIRWSGILNSTQDLPLYIDGPNVKTYRRDNVGATSSKTYTGVSPALFGAWHTGAVIAEPSRLRTLIVNGTVRGSVTHDNLGLGTMTQCCCPRSGVTAPYVALAYMAIWSGNLTGGSILDQYRAQIRPCLLAEAAKFGGLAA